MKAITEFEKPLQLKNDGKLQVFFLGVGENAISLR